MELQPVPNCLVCGRAGRVLHTGLRDPHTSLDGEWSLTTCDRCKVTWLNPRPAGEAVDALYNGLDEYYTHDTTAEDWDSKLIAGGAHYSLSERLQLDLFARYVGRPDLRRSTFASRLAAAVLWVFPPVRDVIGGRVGWLKPQPGARLLDVGCGSGGFLALMRYLGWDVSGVEPDAQARHAAWSRYELAVHPGDVSTAQLDANSFDVVTSFHAIEHMERPFELIAGGLRLLRPGGTMLIVTPNGFGLGHRLFGASFSDLLPPRHLHIFSGQVLAQKSRELGAAIVSCRSTARRGHTVWMDSWSIRRGGGLKRGAGHLQKMLGLPFQMVEEAARLFDPMAGDEIVLVLAKPPE